MYIKYEYIVKANASSEASYARKYAHNVTYARIHTHTRTQKHEHSVCIKKMQNDKYI